MTMYPRLASTQRPGVGDATVASPQRRAGARKEHGHRASDIKVPRAECFANKKPLQAIPPQKAHCLKVRRPRDHEDNPCYSHLAVRRPPDSMIGLFTRAALLARGSTSARIPPSTSHDSKHRACHPEPRLLPCTLVEEMVDNICAG